MDQQARRGKVPGVARVDPGHVPGDQPHAISTMGPQSTRTELPITVTLWAG
jgi:hypothetical protein